LGFTAAAGERHDEAVASFQSALQIYADLGADGARTTNTRCHLAASLMVLNRREEARALLCTALSGLTPSLEKRFGAELLRVGETLLDRPVAATDAPLPEALSALARALDCQNPA
jgi:hypothetical protein